MSQSELSSVIGYGGAGGKTLVSAIATGIPVLQPKRVTELPAMLRTRLVEAEEPQLWKDVFAFLPKTE